MSYAIFNLAAVLYAAAGVYTLVVVVKQRMSLFDHLVTRQDINLAWMMALFVFVPLGVLVHEGGHYLAAQHFGATDIELHHRGYWGFVRYNAVGIDGFERLVITAAGPVAGVLLGQLCLVGAVVMPVRVRMIFRHILAFFGVIEVFHNAIGYPLLDLLGQTEGDFHTLYGMLPTQGIVLVALVHGAIVALLALAFRSSPTRELINP